MIPRQAASATVMKPRQVMTKSELKRKSLECFLFFSNHPLMGVYNTKTGEIFLWPCIKEKVGLVRAISGVPLKYECGFRLDANLQMIMGQGRLTPEEMSELNQSNFLPRVIAETMDDLENDRSANRLTGHEYILELCGELGSIRDYRGFTIIQSGCDVRYIWDSGALNSPYDDMGVRQRKRGAKVPDEEQEKIKAVIDKWNRSLPERYISALRFIVNLTTNDNEDAWAGKAETLGSILFFSSSKEVPIGIHEMRRIINDNSIPNDKQRMEMIIQLAKDKLNNSKLVMRDSSVIELYRLLAGGTDNLMGIMTYNERLRAQLGIGQPRDIPAPAAPAAPSVPATSATSAAASAASAATTSLASSSSPSSESMRKK